MSKNYSADDWWQDTQTIPETEVPVNNIKHVANPAPQPFDQVGQPQQFASQNWNTPGAQSWNRRPQVDRWASAQVMRRRSPGASIGIMVGIFGLLIVIGVVVGLVASVSDQSFSNSAPSITWEERQTLENNWLASHNVELTSTSLRNYELTAQVMSIFDSISAESSPSDIATLMGLQPNRIWYWDNSYRIEWESIETFDHISVLEAEFSPTGELQLVNFRTRELASDEFMASIPTLRIANGMSIAEVLEITKQAPAEISMRFVTHPTLDFLTPGGWVLWRNVPIGESTGGEWVISLSPDGLISLR
jgi:hypothetical protein